MSTILSKLQWVKNSSTLVWHKPPISSCTENNFYLPGFLGFLLGYVFADLWNGSGEGNSCAGRNLNILSKSENLQEHKRINYIVILLKIQYNWGLWCQKQVSQAGISNYIPQNNVGCNYLSIPDITASGTKVHDFRLRAPFTNMD